MSYAHGDGNLHRLVKTVSARFLGYKVAIFPFQHSVLWNRVTESPPQEAPPSGGGSGGMGVGWVEGVNRIFYSLLE